MKRLVLALVGLNLLVGYQTSFAHDIDPRERLIASTLQCARKILEEGRGGGYSVEAAMDLMNLAVKNDPSVRGACLDYMRRNAETVAEMSEAEFISFRNRQLSYIDSSSSSLDAIARDTLRSFVLVHQECWPIGGLTQVSIFIGYHLNYKYIRCSFSNGRNSHSLAVGGGVGFGVGAGHVGFIRRYSKDQISDGRGSDVIQLVGRYIKDIPNLVFSGGSGVGGAIEYYPFSEKRYFEAGVGPVEGVAVNVGVLLQFPIWSSDDLSPIVQTIYKNTAPR